jgi:aldehyde:ferredoxin oxidoreductase
MFAHAGTILHVDLTAKKVWRTPLPEDLRGRFIGGRGVNAKLLWDLVRPGIDPLSPENVLIFGAGALTCTTAPSSGRTTVTCKSPATHLYLKCSGGGHFGSELKFAGYDHLVLHGAAARPAALLIVDDDVQVVDASDLWGMSVRETNAAMKQELGDPGIRVACIGSAGEHGVPFAAIMLSVYHAAARGGVGAVMGSKKLKAIAVKGTGAIAVSDPARFTEVAQRLRDAFLWDMQGRKYFLFGTGVFGAGVAYNYLRGPPASGELLTGPYLIKKGYLKRHVGCFGCTQSCHRYTEVATGPYAGTYTLGPEFETFSALGAGVGISDPETVIKANDLVGEMGLDSISTGVVIQWAMESYERGVLTRQDTDELDLRFGNDDALLRLIPMIARREGRIGALLAQGVKTASEQVGRDSYKWALCNAKGLEQSRVETRAVKAYALAFAVNPRGPDHLHTECMAAGGGTGDMRDLLERITGDPWPASATRYPEIVKWHEDIYAAAEALGFCAFTCTSAMAILEEEMAEIYSLAVGRAVDADEILRVGERVLNLEKCFNVREGADRRLDDLPWRIMNEPLPSGQVTSKRWLDEMLDRYYALHGWDVKTSWPTPDTLEQLGLDEAATYIRGVQGSDEVTRRGGAGSD